MPEDCQSEGRTCRCFVAIPVGDHWTKELAAGLAQLKKADQARRVRWVSPRQIHLTLCFMGNIPAAAIGELTQQLEVLAKRHAAFPLTLEDWGGFPSLARPTVIWRGVGGDLVALGQLQQDIVAVCTPLIERPDAKPFRPHLTIGRVRRGLPSQVRKLLETNPHKKPAIQPEWVSAFSLYESQPGDAGYRYVVRGRFFLGEIEGEGRSLTR